ncbi:MAG: glycosyltransferase family 9 protein [Gammaproteobacteria bacterium]|nr:glycosyltransferase family 9 protein [Gammaproteobacteria bacterium]
MILDPLPPLNSICIIRLSALGDVCLALPAIRAIQLRWPQAKLTWIIGKAEYALVGDIPDIEFIVFDKKAGIRAYVSLSKMLRKRRFDVLLHMQTALRASLVSSLVRAAIRLGFDQARAKELQWVFTNQHIEPHPRQHAADMYMAFAHALDSHESTLRWDIPVPVAANEFVRKHLPGSDPVLAINVSSGPSRRVHRNWYPERFAAVADYAQKVLGFTVVLCGGTSQEERAFAAKLVENMETPPMNLVGKTDLKQLLALLQRANVLITSDSGPAHMATAVHTPVIGLYAATNPYQTGPCQSLAWVVNRYPQAVLREYGKPVEVLPWGIRVHDRDAMHLIELDDVIAMLSKFVQHHPSRNFLSYGPL